MNLSFLLAMAAAAAAACLAAAVLLRERRTFASWTFFAGMLLFSGESALQAASAAATEPESVLRWQTLILIIKATIPGVWLAFSLVYSRGNYREFLRRWRLWLGIAAVLPLTIALGFHRDLIYLPATTENIDGEWLRLTTAGKTLNGLLLIGSVLILTNLEKTFQLAVGIVRWRMKFLLLGLVLIFGARIYTRSQGLLFSGWNLSLIDIETGGVLIGCVLIGYGQARGGLSGVNLYPSHEIIRRSLTVLFAGGYLFVVGLLAQITTLFGGSRTFHLQALFVLVAMAAFGILLFSERVKQRLELLVSRHFRRPQHNFRAVWTTLTERLTRAHGEPGLCTTVATVVCETFNALSVTIWLLSEREGRLTVGASTAASQGHETDAGATILSDGDLLDLHAVRQPCDLENVTATWGERIRAISSRQFSSSGHRIVTPLVAGDRLLGLMVLADRVYQKPYSPEELELLRCIGDQLAAGLLNLRLGQDLLAAKEFETFQAMSAFFVHDLKNSASSLNLMLKNLPQHFDNPEFREDALRGLGKATGRINDLISRLGSFRDKPSVTLKPIDLDGVIREVLGQFISSHGIQIEHDLRLTQSVRGDSEQLRSVITNLVLNADEAGSTGGAISVATEQRDGRAILTVADKGCGMSSEFINRSLFRPFQTTKKKGIGIGMFQSRMIVEAHQGRIQVESSDAAGTTFRIFLPLFS